ncbi:hypothetical protein GP486_007980 [Trichoglossum hirsutum]|uniref:Uncharacterized protein n=1 Tax=Trichoglossum hirsutum TaxID=265104 RepID=A0A9P8IAU6_9PEZI|nr:hypothetical protein GP486_007980 [Trichoglossum hirsutum]
MSEHAQPLTASRLCLIPRLIPAPQALLKPCRPIGLPSKNATIVGVYSGAMVTELNYFANLLHPLSDLVPLTVHVINISHKEDKKKGTSTSTSTSTSRSRSRSSSRRKPSRLFNGELGQNNNASTGGGGGDIVPRNVSPLSVLTIGSAFLTIGLLVWSILIRDGVAVVAILTISAASSIVGLASLWEPKLTKRALSSRVPPGDLVLRTRKGAFLVIHCSEEIARELYIGTEECSYTIKSGVFPALVGVGTLLLMIAVVLMGNCEWVMQLAIGVSYILLNGLYWCAALLPARWHWNLGRYEITGEDPRKLGNYTEALWEAIRAASKDEYGRKRGDRYSTDWVQTSSAAPKTPAWNNWLKEAEQHVNDGTEDWNAVEAWQKLQKEEEAEAGLSPMGIIRRTTEKAIGLPLNENV